MKLLKKIFIILIIISISITSMSCIDTSELDKLTDELEEPLAEVKKTIEEETPEEKPVKKKSEEELIEAVELAFVELKEEIKKVIEDDFGGKLTKFVHDSDNNKIYLAYNSMWLTEDTIGKEIFDIVSLFALGDCDINLDIVATNDFGNSYHSYTKTEILIKMTNYEISYEEWIDEAFLK